MNNNFDLSTPSVSSTATLVAPYLLPEYERISYYNGICDDGDHPELLYRSDYAKTSYPMPTGTYFHLPVKLIHGVFNTPLNLVWDTVGPEIRDLIKAHKIEWSAIDPCRFVTHADDEETLDPVVIWVAVDFDSTSPQKAHEVSLEILALLRENGVEEAEVEWREASLSRLASPPLMPLGEVTDTTAHFRRHFTAALNMPLVTKERQEEDSQGSLTLYFYDGDTKTVLGVSNCHVLLKDPECTYEFKGSGAPKQWVRVNGMRSFQKDLEDITANIATRRIIADFHARSITRFGDKLKEKEDTADRKALVKVQSMLAEEQDAIAELNAFHSVLTKDWSDIENRSIGHLRYVKAVSVDVAGGTRYTEDWGAFELIERKVKDVFEGNVVDLDPAFSPDQVTAKIYTQIDLPSYFKYPGDRRHSIDTVAKKEDLAQATTLDDNANPSYVVAKDGTKTGLTFGRFAGLVSFTRNDAGVDSVELGIYNWGEGSGVFSDKGDSGANIWDGRGRFFGQLHSGINKGGLSSNHVTYATPGWWLIQRIKLQFPRANFFIKTWPVTAA